MKEIKKFKYIYSEDYDSEYKVKDEKVACFSKSKLDDVHPDGYYCVFGETIRKNKKDQTSSIVLNEEPFSISEYNGHSKLFFKKVGYVRVTENGYIALLKRRIAIIIILLGIILIGLIAILLALFHKEEVAAPTFSSVNTDRNAIFIYLPSGDIRYKTESDVSKFNGYDLTVYIRDDDGLHEVHWQKVTLDEEGSICPSNVNFETLRYELKEGIYKGEMHFSSADKTEKLSADVYITQSYSGSTRMQYKSIIDVDLSTKTATFFYRQVESTRNASIIQIILMKGSDEVLLAQSGIVYPGDTVEKLEISETAINSLEPGEYEGYIRVFFDNGPSAGEDINTDIKQTVVIK